MERKLDNDGKALFGEAAEARPALSAQGQSIRARVGPAARASMMSNLPRSADGAPTSHARSLRVLAVLPSDDFTGPSGQVVSTAAVLRDRGIEVSFLMLCRKNLRTGRLPGILEAHGIPYDTLEDRSPFDRRLLRDFREYVRLLSPHIVETHGYKPTAMAFLAGRARRRWAWVGFFHGVTAESRRATLYHWADKHMLRRADRVVTISRAQKQRHFRDIPTARVVYSGVPLTDREPSILDANINLRLQATPRPRVAVVGRLSPEKGQDVFLRAVAVLVDRGVNFSALLIGDGPARADLVALVRELGIAEQTHFLGQVSSMGAVYKHLDVLAIPSLSEGLPSVLLEALAADIRIIATPVGAIPDVLSIPGSGTLVEAGSVSLLADAISAAIASPASSHERSARAEAAQAFSQERRADAMMSIYSEVFNTAP